MAGMFHKYKVGIQSSIEDNSTAYGYSVLVTATLAALNAMEGSPNLGELFWFIGGAAFAFTSIEAAASNFFRDRVKQERSDVIVLGSAMNFIAIGAGLGTVVLVGRQLGSWIAWPVAPLCASVVYLLVTGIELALARAAEE